MLTYFRQVRMIQVMLGQVILDQGRSNQFRPCHVWLVLVRFGQVWSGYVRSGHVDLPQTGQDNSDNVRAGKNKPGQVKSVQAMSCLFRTGQGRSGQDSSGLFKSALARRGHTRQGLVRLGYFRACLARLEYVIFDQVSSG